jgi:hypothetical protein
MRRAASAFSMALSAALGVSALSLPGVARAEPAPATEPATAPITNDQVDLESDTKARGAAGAGAEAAGPPPEAPPPIPYKKTFVLDSTVGAIGFLGNFGKVAPPGPWLHTQLGYEALKWLMFFGEGELAFSDTSNSQKPPKTRAFPLYGFGGGVRFTIRFTDRFGVYLQGSIGAMKIDIARNALGVIGFRDAESLGAYAGGRLGVEWYQIDRHFALGLNGGVRDAQSFASSGARGSDTPLVLDGGASLRYAF